MRHYDKRVEKSGEVLFFWARPCGGAGWEVLMDKPIANNWFVLQELRQQYGTIKKSFEALEKACNSDETL